MFSDAFTTAGEGAVWVTAEVGGEVEGERAVRATAKGDGVV